MVSGSSLQESEGGLYVCMNSFLGFGSQYVDRHHARTGQRAYFHITRSRKAKVDTLIYSVVCCMQFNLGMLLNCVERTDILNLPRRKMTVTLDLDTHPRKSPPDWL